ncbi:MAG: hypothetical protein IJB57_01245 [Clostridia bacterium]|nr:hypothetical protein [Clostridia bacterium]
MDKIVFLATLAGKLSEYQMPSDAVESSVAQVRGYIDRVSDAEFAADPATEADVAAIAKDIYEKYLEAKEAEAVKEPESTPEAEAVEEPAEITKDAAVTEESEITEADIEKLISDDEPPAPEEIIEQLVVTEELAEEPTPVTSDEEFFEMLAKEAEGERNDQARIEELELKALSMANKDDPEVVAHVLSQDEKLVEIVAASDIAEEFDPIEGAFDPTQRPDLAYEESEVTRVFSTAETGIAPDLMIDKDNLRRVDEGMPKKKKKVKPEREKVKGSPLFWTLFILTLPITVPLFLTVCAVFGVLYVAVTALIVAFAGAMIGVVACGTALALVGIIYGATQCFKALPIGLFEIGVGIALGGVTMLVSVLLYNIAIRYIPRLYKLVSRFGGWVFGGIGQLYNNLKKECGKKK